MDDHLNVIQSICFCWSENYNGDDILFTLKNWCIVHLLFTMNSKVCLISNIAYLQIRQVKVSFTSISHGLEQKMDLKTFSFDIHLLFI
jgi:hypothetical protein